MRVQPHPFGASLASTTSLPSPPHSKIQQHTSPTAFNIEDNHTPPCLVPSYQDLASAEEAHAQSSLSYRADAPAQLIIDPSGYQYIPNDSQFNELLLGPAIQAEVEEFLRIVCGSSGDTSASLAFVSPHNADDFTVMMNGQSSSQRALACEVSYTSLYRLPESLAAVEHDSSFSDSDSGPHRLLSPKAFPAIGTVDTGLHPATNLHAFSSSPGNAAQEITLLPVSANADPCLSISRSSLETQQRSNPSTIHEFICQDTLFGPKPDTIPDSPATVSSYSDHDRPLAKAGVIRASRGRRKQEPKHWCDCGQSFTTKNGLRNHDNAHRGVRPHRCQHCSQSFVTKHDCKRHETSCRKRL